MFKIYSQLTKFGIVIFALLAGIAGYAAAYKIESPFEYMHFLKFVLGLYLLSSGSLALNQVQEWKLDQLMPRTKNRPLASGILTPAAGLIISLTLLFLGLALLFELNVTCGIVSLSSVLLYNVFYTMYWKRSWIFAAVPGAIPGALPVTIGFASIDPNIFSPDSIYLFLILFLWQMPHFWMIAIRFRNDYELGGIPTLPVALGVERTLFHVGLYTFAYAGVAMTAPFFLHVSWFFALLVVPFVFFLLKEFFKVLKSNAERGWFSFFMWTNVSVLVFLFIPALDKWSFLLLGRV